MYFFIQRYVQMQNRLYLTQLRAIFQRYLNSIFHCLISTFWRMTPYFWQYFALKFLYVLMNKTDLLRCIGYLSFTGERGGSVVECRTPEREVRGSRPTAAVLCPWARHFTPRKYWLITQEAMAPSRYDWKIVDWDVKPQHNQPTNLSFTKDRIKHDL